MAETARAYHPATEQGTHLAMIGRDNELRVVESFLDGAGPGVRGLHLHGEPGIGKTTIWQAALESASRRGYGVVVTRPAEAEARLPFAALNDLFGWLVDEAPPVLPPPQQAALDVALMRSTVQAEPVQPLALSLAVLELVRMATERQPLVIAIDDVQWLDESSASVLRFALRRLETEPVVIIATERTQDGLPSAPILAELATDRVTRVAVTPLGEEAVDRLLRSALALELAPNLLRRVHRMSGGNPFYAVEIGRALQERGVGGTTDEVPLPKSLAALLRSRLDALSPDAGTVVAHASALSQPTVAVLTTALGSDRAHRGLAEAREAGVLTGADERIRFAHPLLAAEAYAGVPDGERRELHRTLAAVVREPEELGRHLALAASGPDPAVAEALDAAAGHAHGRGAPDAAAELSEMAADLTRRGEPARYRRLASAGRLRVVAGDFARARQLLESGLGESPGPRGASRAELLAVLAMVRQLMDDFNAAEAIAREALRHAGDDVALKVEIKMRLAGISHITGRSWSSGWRHASDAWRLADELGDPRLIAATIGHYAAWRYATGHGRDAELVRRAAEVERWTAHLRTLDLPAFDFSGMDHTDGHTAAHRAGLLDLLERAERGGDYSSLPFLLANAALTDLVAGEVDMAAARLDRAVRLAQVTDQRTAQAHVFVMRATFAARTGDPDTAWASARRSFELMAVTGWTIGEWFMRANLALLELSRGDAAAALDAVAGTLGPARSEPSGRWAWGAGAAVDALIVLGRLEEAGVVADAAERLTRRRRWPRQQADVLRARGRLLAAQGDLDAATAVLDDVEARHRRMEDPWELSRTLLVAGDVHRRARRRARARATLEEALGHFSAMASPLWAQQTREQLRRISAAREVGGGLTRTQREVAELVAGGLTNRQVADRLFMSPHTVEAHLSAVYRALGIRSRVELGAALSRAGEADPGAAATAGERQPATPAEV